MVLIQEESPLAAKYRNKSVAEQNSVDLAWGLLMQPKYEKLRACICGSDEEFARFRQLVVLSVMATDIMDKDLGAARKARWNKAFSEGDSSVMEVEKTQTNRKATIVLEHLIQASDISHTMQVRALGWLSLYLFCLELQTISVLTLYSHLYCSIGISMPAGMSDCFWKCTKALRLGELKRIQASAGMKENLASLTFTSSPLPRNYSLVVSLEYQVMSF
jgi:3'5'-cyclic nucleotide phosphodiesterase